jgi:hypothetical protein
MNSFDSLVWRCIAALMASVALVGCAVAPPEKKPAPPATVFYPSAPEPPRIQHLATFVGERDFDADRSDFAKFVAGEAAGQQMQQVYGFDLVEQKFSVFSGSGGGRMKSPINLTIDVDGTKYVTDTGRDQVLVYDRDNRFVSAFGEPQQFRPVDTAVVGERLYVVDIQHHQVHVLDKRSGKPLFKFGQPGSKEGDLYHPTNIAVGPDGDIFVTETSNFRVQRFTAEGKFVRVYGQVGDRPGSFARPKGIAIDRAGRIYVGDAAFQNVQVFENDGRLLMAFGQPKDGQGLSLPAGVAIDYDNVALFKRYADPKFEVEYLIVVASQIAPNKVDVFGFGRMGGVDYDRAPPAAKR